MEHHDGGGAGCDNNRVHDPDHHHRLRRIRAASDAVALGTRLAKACDASLILALVLRDPPLGVGQAQYRAIIDDVVREERERTLEPVRERLDLPDVRVQVVAAPSPARGLHAMAEREAADLIVVGSSHRGAMGRVLAGSIAERLLHGSPCALAVAPVGYATRDGAGLAVVGVAYDGGNESRVGAYSGDGARTSRRRLAPADRRCRTRGRARGPGCRRRATYRATSRPKPWTSRATRSPASATRRSTSSSVGLAATGWRDRSCSAAPPAGLVRHAPFPVVVVPRGADRPVFEHARAVERAER